jgi:hypothetical protein
MSQLAHGYNGDRSDCSAKFTGNVVIDDWLF